MEKNKGITMIKLIIIITVLILLTVGAVIIINGLGRKIVATKEMEDTSAFYSLGKYTVEIEACFKKDKLVSMKEIYIMKSEIEASTMFSKLLSENFSTNLYGLIDISSDNNVVTVETNIEKYTDFLGEGTFNNRKNIKENLEEEGYEIDESFYIDF